jgi:hypothetical protein
MTSMSNRAPSHGPIKAGAPFSPSKLQGPFPWCAAADWGRRPSPWDSETLKLLLTRLEECHEKKNSTQRLSGHIYIYIYIYIRYYNIIYIYKFSKHVQIIVTSCIFKIRALNLRSPSSLWSVASFWADRRSGCGGHRGSGVPSCTRSRCRPRTAGWWWSSSLSSGCIRRMGNNLSEIENESTMIGSCVSWIYLWKSLYKTILGLPYWNNQRGRFPGRKAPTPEVVACGWRSTHGRGAWWGWIWSKRKSLATKRRGITKLQVGIWTGKWN